MKASPLHFYMRIFYQSLKRAVSILAILCLIITSVPAVSFADADTGETSDFVLVDEDGNQYPAVKDPSVSMVGYNNRYPTEATKGFYVVDVPRGVDFKKIETNLTTDNWSEALQGSKNAGKNLAASELLTADRLTGDYARVVTEAQPLRDTISKYDLHRSDVRYFFACTPCANAKTDDNGDKIRDEKNQIIYTTEYIILIRVGAVEGTKANKETLQSEINSAKALSEDDYYTAGDNFNGKTTSSAGFWTEFQTALSNAETVNSSDTASQSKVDLAAKTLTETMAALISKQNINATGLYQALQSANTIEKESNYSSTTWKIFSDARDAAQQMLDSLYVQEGEHTGEPSEANKYSVEKAAEVDSLTASLTMAQAGLYSVYSENRNKLYTDNAAIVLPKLISMAERERESDYTEESWAAFAQALSAAKAAEKPAIMGTEEDEEKAEAYYKAFDDLYDAYYWGLTPKADTITVAFQTMDPIGARSEKNVQTSAGYKGTLTVTGGTTLEGLLSQIGITPRADGTMNVYINGVYVSKWYIKNTDPNRSPYSPYSTMKDIKVHDGDDITIVWQAVGSATAKPTTAALSACMLLTEEWWALSRFTQQDEMTVEAGKSFTLNVESAKAALSKNYGDYAPADGMTLFEIAQDDAKTATMLTSAGEGITTENGSAELTLYKEGRYLIAAYDIQEDIKGNDYDEVYTQGVYHSLNSGALIWINVTKSEDEAAVKEDLKEELNQYYEDYGEKYFTSEDWAEIKEAYADGIEAIAAAADLAEAREAQQEAISTITSIQQQMLNDTASKLKAFRTTLSKLPDDPTLLTESVESEVSSLIEQYEAFSSYQVSELTPAEIAKYAVIKAAVEQGLGEAKQYSLSLKVEADSKEAKTAIADMISWLQTNNTNKSKSSVSGGNSMDIADLYKSGATDNNKIYEFAQMDATNTLKSTNAAESDPLDNITFLYDVGYFAYMHVRDSADHRITGDGWEINDESFDLGEYMGSGMSQYFLVRNNMTVLINGEVYEIKDVTVDGVDKDQLEPVTSSLIDRTDYKGKDKTTEINVYFGNSGYSFPMPYNDVTVTVTWGKVDLDSQKTAAIQAIEEAYDGYFLTDYDEAGQAALENAMKDGIDNVEKATTEDGIAAARKAALAAMAAVAKKGSSSSEEQTGTAVGRVHVSVENTTYSGAPSALRGRFLDTYVTLYDNDTMMTCILRALKDNDFSWTGTGGTTTKNDTSITYLASIIKGNDELAQFDGGSQSGWMGTLNDFFVNEGFQSFGVKNTGFYKLENGDEISVMYTSQGLGEDIGGSWGNSDTSLKALSVSGGTLSPAFDGKTLEYTLIIPDDTANVVVTPTAANKNYLVRTYLNSYKKESAFYKRSESIPVKNGDVIYIGIGETEWPSMNKQGTEARDYTATKYTIKVVKAGAKSVNAAIQALPSEDKITYANYKNYVSAVTSAKEMYDALTSSDKAEVKADDTAKLNAAVQKIQFYADIDNVKALLAALPNSDKVTDSQLSGYRSQINAATAAYTKLNDEQKKYITINDVDNYNKLAERLGMTSITGSEEMPESDVATANGITTAPTQVVVSGDTATATVKADTMAEILKQASENKSKVIELQVADGDVKDATKIALELSKTSASNIAAKTDASLQVTTPLGSVTMDQTALNEAIKAASGSDLTIVLEKQTVAEADKDLLGSDAAQTKVSILSGGKEITDLGTGKVTISLPVTSDLKDKELGVVYTDSEGKLVKVSGKLVTINGKQYYQIETSKPETFTLAEAAKIDAAIKAQGGETDEEKAERIKAGVQATTIKLRSTFSKKNNIQLNWTKSKGYKVDYYEVFKSTKRYSGFGTKAYYKTSTGTKNFYINTKELKKGTRYFYKVRGVRVINGEKVYTQWSNKAWRISRVNRK